MEKQPKKAKPFRGFVVSDKMQKTRVARVDRMVKHPVVGKYLKKSSKIMFHDEKNESVMGDEVLISVVRPKSKRKSFELLSIVRKENS